MQKIIIDTDIGDDIDDAMAIALALKSKELEILGVTTVLRDVDKRARMARNMLDVAGRKDIPVYKGIGTPLVHKVDMFHVPPQWSPDMEAYEYNTDMDAVDFMAAMIRKHPGEVTLVPIGPLTNICVLFLKNPDLKDKVKSVNLMGGCYYSFINEYNMEKDPEAAKYLFDSNLPIKAIGLDVIRQCGLKQEHMEKFENSNDPFIKFVMKLITAWRRGSKNNPCLCDPMAVFSVFDDKNTIEYEEKYIDVEVGGEFTKCMTIPHDRDWYGNLEGYHEKKKVMIAKSVRAKEFIDLYMERVIGG